MNINDIQNRILCVVSEWVRTEKTPISQKTIIELVLLENTYPRSTVKAAVRVLVKKGYIRKACTIASGVSYVQLRTA